MLQTLFGPRTTIWANFTKRQGGVGGYAILSIISNVLWAYYSSAHKLQKKKKKLLSVLDLCSVVCDARHA